MINYEKKVLDNGLRVVVAPMENTEAVTLLVLVGVGSRHETKELNGISHFLEHMCFKRTKNYPKPGQLHREIERTGAVHNAFTDNEVTGYWVKASSDNFDMALAVISDMYLNLIFKEEDIEKERGVILQEISMYEDDPATNIHNIFHSTVYGDQPFGRLIIGTPESVKGIKKKDLERYRKDNYLSENSIVVVAGGIDKKIALKKIENAFKKARKGKNKKAQKVKISQKSPNVKVHPKKVDQAHLVLGTRVCSMFDDNRHVISVISNILGGGISSRLAMEIREKLGLAYYVYAYNEFNSDTGYLGVVTGVPDRSLEKVVKKIKDNLHVIKNKKVSNKELKEAKSCIKGRMALRFESTDHIASYLATQELFYGKIMQPQEILRKVEKVTQNDILKVAKDIFRPEKINMAVIGSPENQKEQEEFYKNILKEI